ncbi:protein peste-like isoform X2 [Bacillus rossius redtenbacheri]|uniref:protein peste-like isoform X2 n=1 Tax=Bacillus rossius redtenbacheri TaxID=93214 RepID=UPI002FDC7F7E
MFKAGCWKKLVFCVGVLLLLAGGICHLYIDEIFQHTVVKMLQLTPNAAHYEVWRKTPVPLQMRIYMFNWTNAEKFGVAGVKPNFLQLGPYTFTEHHEKVNITWNPNNTVSYRQIRRWQFDPSNSNGSLSDQVTTVDLLVATASYLARDWGYILQTSLSLILDTSGKRPHMTHTVGEMLFEGYEEPLIAVGSKLAFISKLNIPFDKFGWFYQRNGSASFEGTYSIATGVDDADNIGRLVEWNHANHTPFYPGQCGMVNGSAGEMWPPFRQKTHTIAAFVPDFCRSLSLDYAREQTVHGLRGYRYSAGARNFDDGTLYPDNKCFCGGKCVPSGVLNVSACRFGGPAFLSYPHFYKADPYYLQQVDGMEPDPDSHEYYVTLEPDVQERLDGVLAGDVAGRQRWHERRDGASSVVAGRPAPHAALGVPQRAGARGSHHRPAVPAVRAGGVRPASLGPRTHEHTEKKTAITGRQREASHTRPGSEQRSSKVAKISSDGACAACGRIHQLMVSDI